MKELKALEKLLKEKALEPEQVMEGMELIGAITNELNEKPVIDKEQEAAEAEMLEAEKEINAEAVQTEELKASARRNPLYPKLKLKKMKEDQVVAIAKQLGIDASADDLKADTIDKIMKEQGN